MKLHAKGSTGMLAALALFAQGARAQGGAAAGSMQPSRVMIATKDSFGVSRFIVGSPLIDSLVKKLNGLAVGSPEFVATNAAIESAFRDLPRPAGGTFTMEITTAPRAALAVRSPMDVVPLGTLGFTADGVNRPLYGPGGNYLQYFEYPTVVAIEANSPASRAGVRIGDLVMAYNGVDLTRNPINMTGLLAPGREVTVRLRHDNEMRDALMTVEKASAALIADRRAEAINAMNERRLVETQAVAAAARSGPPTPLGKSPVAAGMVGAYRDAPVAATTIGPSVNGVLGAAMTDVDGGLSLAIRGMEGRRGVFITRVPVGSLADRTGLRTGDVILRVGDSDVTSLSHLRVRLYAADQSGPEKIKLTIMREGKTQDVTYYTRDR